MAPTRLSTGEVGETGIGSSRLDDLPEDVLRAIFSRLPHLNRLRSRLVSTKWNRILKLVEPLKRPGPLWCLALEKVSGREVQCCTFHPATGRKIPLPLTFPPGWCPAARGGVRGGGRSGLVAFFDYTGERGQYWVGNPVHNKWQKIPEPPPFWRLPFGRQRFEFVGLEFSSGFYIVQFLINETLPPPGCTKVVRDHTNWVSQVYSSRPRTWSTGPILDPVVFKRLEHTCVVDRTIYFTGFDEEGELVIWKSHLYDKHFTKVTPAGCVGMADCLAHFSSIQLRLKENGNSLRKRLRMLLLGKGSQDDYEDPEYRFKIWEMKLDGAEWFVEHEIPIEYYSEHPEEMDDDLDLSLGVNFAAHTLKDLRMDDEPFVDQGEGTRIFCYKKEQRHWTSYTLECPVSPWNELPGAAFLPCECCP